MNGLITVISGPTFAGKTKKLIECYHNLKKVNKKILVFKPTLDTRYSENEIVSHDKEKIPTLVVEDIKEIRKFLDQDTEVILIDEIQLFFSEEVVGFLNDLAKEGKEIIVAGLEWDDFANVPFSSVAGLLAAADKVIKLAGTCDICGDRAIRNQWKLDWLPQEPSDYIGGAEKYGSRCRLHYVQPQGKKFALVIISGPSGVGKTEVAKRLLNYQELDIQTLTGFTTRLPRQGEIEGQEYYFVSREEFLKKIADNQFLEYAEYNGNYYGNSLSSLKKVLLTKNILLIVEVKGFQKIKTTWSENKITSFWLQPPNRDKLLSNLRKRGDKEEDIEKRLAIAETEMPFAKEYDHIFTVNDNLDQVAEEIKSIVFSSIEQQQQEFQSKIEVPPKK